MANPNNIDNQNQHPNNSGWESLDSLDENKNRAKQFTNQELERLAKATGRMPDDEGVIGLNLALRYKEYQKYHDIYDEAKKTNTMIQQGIMEDIATAKRELEEAMYLYDQKFENIDNAKVNADTEQKQKELKESYRRSHNFDGVRPDMILKAQERRDENERQFTEKRETAAQNLTDELPDIVDNIQNSEIYKTYELNKDAEPSVKERRAGFTNVGKDGFYDSDKRIDWALYPHAPEISDSNLDQESSQVLDPDNSEVAPAPTDANEVLALPGPVLGETPMLPEPEKHQVDLGEDALKNIEHTIDEDKAERSKELEEKLDKMTPELAELYARNRRLIVGAENRAAFTKAKGEYEKLLDESLRLKAEVSYESGKSEISERLAARVDELNKEINEKLLEFVDGDPENTYKTQEEVDTERKKLVEEAEKTLRAEYSEMVEALETKVNADFLDNFLEQQSKLEDATIDKLDNGTLCRKLVHKVLNNKVFKGALIAAGVAGLAMTGVGLATGAVTVGLGYTAAGVAAGVGRGALMGGLMSRQDSKNSAVHDFADEETIKQKLEGIDVLDQDSDTSNVAGWLMEQYSGANTEDRGSNIKKTAVAAGLGAAIGAAMSGLQFSSIEKTPKEVNKIVGYEPVEYEPTMIDNVNVPEGGGAYYTFTQMGGNPEDLQRAVDIMHSIDAKYGMVPGSNGETVGLNGTVGDFAHTYPGRIESWPDVANSYIHEVAEAWAEEGLIPSTQTGGEPIYDTITRMVEKEVPNAFYNFLARGTDAVAAGVVGRVIGEAGPARSGESIRNQPEVEPSGYNNLQDIIDDFEGVRERSASFEENQPETLQGTINGLREARERSASFEENQSQPEAEPTGYNNLQDIIDDFEGVRERSASPEEENQPETLQGTINGLREARERSANFREDNFVREAIPNISDEGAEILSSADGLENVGIERIANWWNTLDDNTKEEISRFESTITDDNRGRAFRNWLELQQ